MKNKHLLTVLLAAGTMLALLGAASLTRAITPGDEPASPGSLAISGVVANKISYQGQLTDAGGIPLNGSYNFVFQLWNDPAAGSQVGSNIAKNNVPVSDGLFTVELQVPQNDFNGQALWLRIQVNGQWLTPRQELLPAPYALSLKPGAIIQASIYDNPVLRIENTDPNPAGGGYALVGKNASNYTWRPAIYGENTGSSAGVYGRSDGWHATVGWQAGGNPDNAGVYGHNAGAGPGVKGYGSTGVYGESSAEYGQAIHGHGTGGFTEGVLGTSDKNVGVYGISGGTSGNAIGVWGDTALTWGLFTNDNLFVGGNCTGCTVAFVGQNADAVPLEVGEVVAISGITDPLKGQQTPVLQVQRASAQDDGFLGVVQARATITATETPDLASSSDKTVTVEMPGQAPGSAATGDYLFVVVQGLVQVRADASLNAIQVGDMLQPTTAGGDAQRMSLAVPETPALGRALESLDEGTGLIWVLILGQ